ncbi:MAG: hypothetical protein ACLQNE_20880 [Thermoguttaceae bacterium]|jgi:hypothetical protein
MKRFWIYGRRLAAWTLVVASWAAMHTAAWAAEAGKTEDEAPQYVLPYATVILGVALGIVVLFNPSRRRDKARIDPLEEKKKPKKG